MNGFNDINPTVAEYDVNPETGVILTDIPDRDDQENSVFEEPEPPFLLYPRLDLYVEDFLAVIYERTLPNGRRTWCPQWWKHDEAVYRLQALWLSWEYMRASRLLPT